MLWLGCAGAERDSWREPAPRHHARPHGGRHPRPCARTAPSRPTASPTWPSVSAFSITYCMVSTNFRVCSEAAAAAAAAATFVCCFQLRVLAMHTGM